MNGIHFPAGRAVADAVPEAGRRLPAAAAGNHPPCRAATTRGASL